MQRGLMNDITWNFSAINKQMASIVWWCSVLLWHPHPWSWQGIGLILNLKSTPQLIKDPLAGGCICVTSCQVRWAKRSVFLNKVSQGLLWDVSSVGHQGQPKTIHYEHALWRCSVDETSETTKPTGHLFWASALLQHGFPYHDQTHKSPEPTRLKEKHENMKKQQSAWCENDTKWWQDWIRFTQHLSESLNPILPLSLKSLDTVLPVGLAKDILGLGGSKELLHSGCKSATWPNVKCDQAKFWTKIICHQRAVGPMQQRL